jgi:hypothetical protein
MRTRLAKVLAAVVVVVGLATPAAAGVAVSVTGPCASVSVADVDQTDDTSPFLFTVTVNAPNGCVVHGSVDYHTVDGTPGAAAPEDYATTTGVLTWSGDAGSRTVAVPVVRDGPGEPNEQFWLQLDKPIGLTIAGGAAVGGILGSISGSTVTIDGSPKCWDVCTVGVHVTGPDRNGVQVRWQTVDNGGGNLGYVPVQDAVLTIEPNAPRGDITVQLDNPNHRVFQFELRIFAPSVGVLGGSTALVTVTPSP